MAVTRICFEQGRIFVIYKNFAAKHLQSLNNQHLRFDASVLFRLKYASNSCTPQCTIIIDSEVPVADPSFGMPGNDITSIS